MGGWLGSRLVGTEAKQRSQRTLALPMSVLVAHFSSIAFCIAVPTVPEVQRVH